MDGRMTGLQVGQQVWVRRRYGLAHRGAITKVGRKLVTIGYGYGSGVQFRIETGKVIGNYGGAWFRTDSEEELAERLGWLPVRSKPRESGLTVESRSKLPLETLESIAKLLEAGEC